MPGLSKVIVLAPDGHAGRQVQLGFQREGVPVELAALPAAPGRLELPEADDASLVVVGGTDARALELVRAARAALDGRRIDVPILFAGRGVPRADVAAAGADEVLLAPAYLRDVVTIGRLLRGQPAAQRAHLVGNLAELTGVLTLVRALSALGRSAVLTLMRGLRRGEIRFFEGEVTSAQVGVIHGQAALHQLLLWTDARFDFHHEDVVRRQQIPLAHDEVFADAERFLAGVRESSGALSPSMVLEQDAARIPTFGAQIPGEVLAVLRMFDGHRVLADVLEDSPYRVFETLRVARRALEVGLLRRAATPRPKATWRAVLAIEEWLVGDDARTEARAEADARRATLSLETGPVAKASEPKGGKRSSKKKKSKKRHGNTPAPIKGPPIDWGALVPRTVGAEAGPLAGVVPAAQAAGEIVAPREKLESLMDTGQRERFFRSDLGEAGREPSVLLGDDTGAKEAAERTERELREGRELAERQTQQAREARAREASEVHDAAPSTPVAPAAVARPIDDEPSDGVVRTHRPTPEPPPPHRDGPEASEAPVDDRPPDTTGEIAATPAPAAPAPAAAEEPSILVADLAAAHTAVSAVAAAQASAAPSATIATPAREAEVQEARRDATGAFTQLEEEFFRAGHEHEKPAKAASPSESFDDLDEGYRPVGFWDRLLGRKKR